MAIADTHVFKCSTRWQGDCVDYDSFSRRHDVVFPGGKTIPCASFLQSAGTDATNPEELLAAAQSSCLMLTFLAVCSRAKINVIRYEDEAEAVLERVEGMFSITQITLRPAITVQGSVDKEKLDSLIEKAHKHCYIANSIKAQVKIEPTYRTV